MKDRKKHCREYAKIYRTRPRVGAYTSWRDMIRRCNETNFKDYKNYGGRGIKVCDRWAIFINFLADMGERPIGNTLDRINNNGNYEPKNCRWASKEEQSFNKRTTHFIEAFGKKKALQQWAKESGISRSLIKLRIYELKWTNEKAVSEPVSSVGKKSDFYLTVFGKTMSLPLWALTLNISRSTIYMRYRKFISGKITAQEVLKKGKL